MADELIDIFDENNQPLNITKMKSEAHKKGLWHRATHIWMYTKKGELLLQLRAKEKDLYPNMWDVSVAGHVSAGEEPIVSALREIEEEIGLEVKQEDLEFVKIHKIDSKYNQIINREFFYIYIIEFKGDIKTLTLQKEEVSNVQLLSLDQIEKDVKNHSQEYVPHGNYWFDIINVIKTKLN